MHYIKASHVKRRIKEHGFRCNKAFLNVLDGAVECIIQRATEWSKPKKTVTGETLAGYLQHKGIK